MCGRRNGYASKLRAQAVDRLTQTAGLQGPPVVRRYRPLVVPQEVMQDRLDLHLREIQPNALVDAAAEGHPPEPMALVLGSLWAEPFRIECVGVMPHTRIGVDGSCRRHDHRAGWNVVAVDRGVPDCLAS